MAVLIATVGRRLARRIVRLIALLSMAAGAVQGGTAQINTDQVMRIGRNAIYFEDYVLAIQYFNAVIAAKPYLAQPYFYRGLAKFYLEDLKGAEADASTALSKNPFLTDAYELRGVVRQNQGLTEEAVADYDEALKMLPYNRGILFNKALALENIKDYDGAADVFSTLLKAYPGFAEGYLGRAKMLMAKGDTVAARADIDHALDIDRNLVNGYIMRADIAINSARDYNEALADMNQAIKLEPKYAGFYINRAFLRHELDDYNGSMADYDYALQLDPLNTVALFNRAMLRAEVHDFNRAVDDLNQVEALKGSDFRTLYNRAVIYSQIGFNNEAEADISRVIDAYPDLAAAYFLRSEIRRAKGDRNQARADYDHSLALAKRKVQVVPGENGEIDMVASPDGQEGESQEEVKARFTRLLTIDDNAEMEQTYGNKSIRGRVQDRNSTIEIEPMFMVTYYTAPTELKPSGDYIREVTDLNDTRLMRFLLQVTNREPKLDDSDEIARHFESIDYHTAYISTHQPRAIDFFARGMDYMTVRNYRAASADFARTVELQPDFTLGWLMSALAAYKEFKNPAESGDNLSGKTDNQPNAPGMLSPEQNRGMLLRQALRFLDKVEELSPDMAINYFDRGVIYIELNDFTSAIRDFTRAIELKPDFGEAHYNRGYSYFQLGNREAGTADLSRAGELGVVPSYNLLKRMSRQ